VRCIALFTCLFVPIFIASRIVIIIIMTFNGIKIIYYIALPRPFRRRPEGHDSRPIDTENKWVTSFLGLVFHQGIAKSEISS